jgi:hypothetical protein
MDEEVRVVIDATAGHHAAHVGHQLLHLEPGDVPREMLRMRADVAQRAGARTRGIGAPIGLLVPRLLERRGQPPL